MCPAPTSSQDLEELKEAVRAEMRSSFFRSIQLKKEMEEKIAAEFEADERVRSAFRQPVLEQKGTKRRPGRPPGGGSYAGEDAKLVVLMKEDIRQTGCSVAKAARNLELQIAGHGSPESRIKRLTKRYYDSETNP